MRRILAAALMLAVLALGPQAWVAAQEENVEDATNGFLTVYFYNSVEDMMGGVMDHTFTVATGESHPHPGENVFYNGASGQPWSSYITVLVEDAKVMYVNSGNQYDMRELNPNYTIDALGGHNPQATRLTDGFKVTWATPHASITQTVRVVGSTLETTMVIHEVKVTNTDTQPHSIGVRVLWDIMIDGEDGSFLRIWRNGEPVTDWLTHEYELNNPDPGMVWQTTNDPEDPMFVIWGGITAPQGVSTPDKLVYGDWPKLYKSGWLVEVDPDLYVAEDDTAVAYYWLPRTLQPGESLHVVLALLPVTTGEAIDRPPEAAEETITPSITTTTTTTPPPQTGAATQTTQGTQPATTQQATQTTPPTSPTAATTTEEETGIKAKLCLRYYELLIALFIALLVGALIARR